MQLGLGWSILDVTGKLFTVIEIWHDREVCRIVNVADGTMMTTAFQNVKNHSIAYWNPYEVAAS